MDKQRIKVAITQGDVNGIGYEVILKVFSDPQMLELCTPVIFGSPKIAAYHSKTLGINTNFSIVQSATHANRNVLSLVNCNEGEVKVELGKQDEKAGKAALEAIDMAIEAYNKGEVDAIVTAPVNKKNIQPFVSNFSGHTEYIQEKTEENATPLMLMINENIKIAIVTTHIPLAKVAENISSELIVEKLEILSDALKKDFGISRPRIAVLGLNPHCGENGTLGDEEQRIIIPAIKEAESRGVICYGPFPADGFFGSENYIHFDAVLAMFHDQGMIPFKALAMEDGVNYTAGLEIVRTSPAHGTAFDIAGKGVASEASMRNAIYTAIDIVARRKMQGELTRNVLRKQYYNTKDDSDKLKLDTIDAE